MKNFSLAIILASSLAFPQQIDSLKLTELESLKLKNAQYQAIIAQQNVDLLQLQLEKAQIQARDTYSTLNSQAEEIKKSHNWGKDVVFSPQDLTFIRVSSDKK